MWDSICIYGLILPQSFKIFWGRKKKSLLSVERKDSRKITGRYGLDKHQKSQWRAEALALAKLSWINWGLALLWYFQCSLFRSCRVVCHNTLRFGELKDHLRKKEKRKQTGPIPSSTTPATIVWLPPNLWFHPPTANSWVGYDTNVTK